MSAARAMLRLAASVAIGGALCAAAAAADDGRPLTLDDALARALEKNESIVVERESLVAADAGIRGAKGAYDPAFAADLGWDRATLPVNSSFSGAPAGKASPTAAQGDVSASVRQLLPTGGAVTVRAATSRDTTNGAFALLSPSYGTQAGIEVRQPLLRDRAIDGARLAVRLAGAEHDRAGAALRTEISETVAAVERAYWTLASARLDVGVGEESVRLAEEQLAETKIRVEKGTAPETEVAQPKAELERRRGELYASREAAARADSALKRLILGDEDPAWTEPLVPSDDVRAEPAPVDVPAAIERALASRPELSQSRAEIARRKAEAQAADDRRKPALDVVASYDRYGLAGSLNPALVGISGPPPPIPPDLQGGLGRSFGTLRDGTFDDLRAGLSLTIPLGNRAARAAAAQARSAERQADAELSGARKAVRAEVLDAAAALETAGQRVDAAVAGREAAEVQLQAERQRYAAGMSTNFLVLTRQNDLSRARLDEIAARTDYRKARTEMARATGSILDDRRIDVGTGPAKGGIR